MNTASNRALGLVIGFISALALLLSLTNLNRVMTIWLSYRILSAEIIGATAGLIGSFGGVFWAKSLLKPDVDSSKNQNNRFWFYLLGIIIGGLAIGIFKALQNVGPHAN